MNPKSFTRQVRLTQAKQYRYVFAKAKRFGNRSMTILVRENEITHPRLGLAIAKKCAKRAVDRNRIKRLIRESFRHHQLILPNIDIIIMCRPLILQQSNDEISQQLQKQWRYIKFKYTTINN